MKLDPEIKKQWVEALRSGKYNQSHGFLATSEGYCCLGVLAHGVLGKGVWTKCGSRLLVDGESSFLPITIWQEIFTKTEDVDVIDLRSVSVIVDEVPTSLVDLNDGCGPDERIWSFEEIANIIEEQL